MVASEEESRGIRRHPASGSRGSGGGGGDGGGDEAVAIHDGQNDVQTVSDAN